MESKTTGYQCKMYNMPVKRYCQTMDLKNDEALIAKYKKAHDRYHAWPEIREGIRAVGILEMEIYRQSGKTMWPCSRTARKVVLPVRNGK